MDFSKSKLQDIHTIKTDKFLNQKQELNPDERSANDLNIGKNNDFHYQLVEASDDKQNPMNLNYKQKESNETLDPICGNEEANRNVSKMIDDVETIEKIAEMVATDKKDSNETKPKTIKRHQILMSRNLSVQNWNNDENKASGSHIETETSALQEKAEDADKKINSISGQANKKTKYDVNSDDPQIDAHKFKSNEISEKHFLEKSRFEEIEDKLEEMFAGIEDEQLINPPTGDKHISKTLDDTINKNSQKNSNSNTVTHNMEETSKSPLPTKAAKKSTNSLSCNENSNQLNSLLGDNINPTIPSVLFLKSLPPRRRLSIGINKDVLKFSIKSNDEINKTKDTRNEDKKSISSNLQTLRQVKQVSKKVPNKINKNNISKSSKYKKEIGYIKSKNYSNKTIIHETHIKAKRKQQNIKHQLLSSENEIEEKSLQIKDIETKHRSPFILVKNNGSVAVVNTVTPDDSSEKITRTKKASSYVYERKTFKGCHSSTLSNRYDADTADSSWKCIFCKIGPHKKGLGDLFGPYIISSDCDEYRSSKDFFEKLQKFRRGDDTVKNAEKLSTTENILEHNYDNRINTFMFGMSQISINCYEIWVHEECAIWTPQIFVVGSRLAGLEEATWNSTRYECIYCLKQGALLCCLQRDCKTTSHVPCAREYKWLLDESKFWVYCRNEVIRKEIIESRRRSRRRSLSL